MYTELLTMNNRRTQYIHMSNSPVYCIIITWYKINRTTSCWMWNVNVNDIRIGWIFFDCLHFWLVCRCLNKIYRNIIQLKWGMIFYICEWYYWSRKRVHAYLPLPGRQWYVFSLFCLHERFNHKDEMLT